MTPTKTNSQVKHPPPMKHGNGTICLLTKSRQKGKGRCMRGRLGYLLSILFVLVFSAGIRAQCPPTITQQPPTAEIICVGAATTFSVTASGNAPLTYQWRKNGVNVSAANITGGTTAAITISNVGPADAGTYDVVITASGCGTTTTSTVTAVSIPATFNPGSHNTNAITA